MNLALVAGAINRRPVPADNESPQRFFRFTSRLIESNRRTPSKTLTRNPIAPKTDTPQTVGEVSAGRDSPES